MLSDGIVEFNYLTIIIASIAILSGLLIISEIISKSCSVTTSCPLLFSLFLFLILAGNAFAAPKLSYKLATPNPQTHYFEVEMLISDVKDAELEIKMPVWAPGSYLVREFAKNVNLFSRNS